ncbi:hypothetical protein DM02DRAFT_49895 [Periconia macrospinosa]|uniref:Uncharacterized protein n=1 Tax=Periconia macrospinosa TaxID=97972 RepID=A0A2V1CX84_9PLEO|nr:hypothetical protein DM02DRAFT_49895 [Periconia macrospinosa]
MKGVRMFKEGLFTFVHLSAGAPARGTKITSIQCENSADGVGYRGFSGGWPGVLHHHVPQALQLQQAC